MRSLLASWLVVVLVLLAAGSGPAAAQNAEIKSATETLRASLDEWRREDAAYRTARGASKISQADAQEYAGFVAGLRLRVLEQCEIVRRLGGEEAVRGFECIRSGAEERVIVVVPPTAVQTEEEKRAALEARLNALESDVDDSLQKRQQEIRQKAGAASARAAAGGVAGGATGGAAGGAAASGASSAAPGSTWGPPPPERSNKQPGEADQAGTEADRSASAGSARPGVPSTAGSPASGRAAGRQTATDGGSDDDVVARQLREAAEKETDPVLKEKLWAEYRKYKESRR